jgi:hypothetical protein
LGLASLLSDAISIEKILSIQIAIASSCHFENTTVHWQNLPQKHQQKFIGFELEVLLILPNSYYF